MVVPAILALSLASLSIAQALNSQNQTSETWGLKNFTSLVTFGDSYTDDSRLGYFITNNGSAPPVGWVDPANYNSASGGRPWPQYVKQYAGVKNLYNYAVSGAVCSSNIVKRTVAVANGGLILFPDIESYETPAFVADAAYTTANGTKFMITPPDETVYSIWIGTNDLGQAAILTDSQEPGKTIPDYLDCVYTTLQKIYDQGGRYFVIQNVAPLNLTPLYGLPNAGGVGNNTASWPTKPSNITAISYRMKEQVATSNAIYEYRTPFAAKVADSFQGAHFALFDMHGLITDMYTYPEMYLNGTAPANVTGYTHHCDAMGNPCVDAESPDSYLWYDPLHPSEQSARVFARTFIEVVKGGSRWATYWSG